MDINLRAVDLNLLTVFDAIMSLGQLSKAAKQLGMTQSAASSALSRLRLTFGDELFIRTRSGMLPTPRAKELIGPIREGLASISSALSPPGDFNPANSKRTFKLLMGDYGEIILLPALFQALKNVGGQLCIQTLSVNDERHRQDVEKAQIDFFIDHQLPTDEHLDYYSIGSDDRLAVIARQKHPRLTDNLSAGDYLRESHIIAPSQRHQLTSLERIVGSTNPIARHIMGEVNQVLAIPSLVSQSDGIATLPHSIAVHFARLYQLAIFPFPYDIGPLPSYLIWHKSLNRDSGHQWLKNVIIDLAGRKAGAESDEM